MERIRLGRIICCKVFIPYNAQVRHKSNVSYSKSNQKTNPTEVAIKHFDSFYSNVYKNNWQSVRLALLSPNKYAAIVNPFADSESIEISLRQIGAFNLCYIYERNLKKILKHLQRSQFLNKNINDTSKGKKEPIFNENVTSESEFESIERFFTDAEDDNMENFVNEASKDLDLNEFVPVTQLKYQEERFDGDNNYFSFYDMNYEVPVEYIEQNTLDIPHMLNLYTFPRNEFSMFPSPKIRNTNLYDYYLLDGASVLPVLALGIKDGDHVADFCAAPGGKSLIMYLTLRECRFFLNEISASRFQRLKNVFNSFVPKSSQNNLMFSHNDASQLQMANSFDKVLVDAPCTNDRHSLYAEDNSIFAQKRINERFNLPQKQLDILFNALNSVKVGGSVVYSTCSLSPIQNDGVVHMALKKVWEETSLNFAVVNLKEAVRPLRGIFKFENFRYGTQVLPFLPSNFGPMYFCKLTRVQ